MTHAGAASIIFDAEAERYDEGRRRLIPPFDSFYASAVDAVRLAGREPERILDLGAGTGLLSSRLRASFPTASLTLLDGAPAMLEQARATLGEHDTEYLVGDLRDPLPTERWDAIVSALAIHHLEDGAKRRLFESVLNALTPGGVFVNAEQVSGPTQMLAEAYAQWHESRARAAGSDDAEWTGAVERMRYDHCASVESQLAWLREAEFTDVDCLFKDYRFAVLFARRPHRASAFAESASR
jgi:tRNA (cmo5U34)-methyltransferase